MKLEKLKDKKVLILGLGREGRDTLKFLRKLFPKKVIGVGDRDKNLKFKNHASISGSVGRDENEVLSERQNSKFVRWHLGENYLKAIKNYEAVIKSPGIPPKIIAPFITKKQIVTSATAIFFENCPGKIVGITGTKGKSTTTSLIYKILKEGKIKAHLVGNIGKAVLNLLFSATKKDVYVYELSSHQLSNLKKSPHIAVFLNIYPEHLDYYRNFREYVASKANITRYQTKDDYLVYNSENKLIREIAKKSKAKKIPFYSKMQFDFLSTWRKSQMRGDFNLLNTIAAVLVGKIFGISQKVIAKAIKSFKPLPHRLEFVGTFKGITFYNDSLSTIPEATIFALNALGKDVQTVILGGFDRGQNFKNLAKRISNSEIKNVILFPPSGKRIWQEINQKNHLLNYFFVDNMSDAVKLSYQSTQKNKICLLSPASPSFGIFKDYKHRGNLFKKYITIYAHH
jgi:UDP-N-acetylmuramoylalanine--D-glutamate ligase